MRGARLGFETIRIEPARAVLLGWIKVDRHRLPQNETVVADRRNMPVGVDRKILGRPRSAADEIDFDMLVVEAEFSGHSQSPEGSRARDAVHHK